MTRGSRIAWWCAGILPAAALFWNPTREPAVVPVRYAEGAVHGFLELETEAGKVLAPGDLLQVPQGDEIESRMVFRFPDGSLFDERVTFTQQRVFTLVRYHLVQRGPAFPESMDARLDRRSGRYRVATTPRRGGEEEVHQGTIDLPPDVYNGMVITVAKNLPPGAAYRVHLVAFTPKPRLIALNIEPTDAARVLVGGGSKTAVHYVLKPRLGAVVGLFARLAGKAPPDNHAWIVTEDVPAFLRFEGPLYVGGPVWRIDLAAPRWPEPPPAADAAPRRQ
jgi:hypothetical protein